MILVQIWCRAAHESLTTRLPACPSGRRQLHTVIAAVLYKAGLYTGQGLILDLFFVAFCYVSEHFLLTSSL